MATEIIVNVTGRETRLALMENGRLAELQIDRGDNRGYVGNVYRGRVVRVLPGMQAAFVDIGLERAAFLYVGDIYLELLHMHEDDDGLHAQDAEARSSPRPGLPPIQDLLTEGQEIVVQVAKDPMGTKGARLTTHIALPGRYLVFMPTVDHVGISRRIDKDRDRKRLRDFVEKHRSPGSGYIVRTVCAGQETESLRADMTFLERTWERIQNSSKDKRAPSLLHEEYGIVLRSVRDLFDDDLTRLVVDDAEVYERSREFVAEFMPKMLDRVQQYRGKEPIFDNYGVTTEMARSLGRKVWLKSGGYLVIDQTEALMAIDVNSGKFVGKTSSLEETTLRINLEAVEEVAYQLRLRNIGGIIIVDCIDMEREANRERVYKAMEDALKGDRARTNVLKISDLGLLQLTRKRVQEGLDRYLNEPCMVCEGTGTVRARNTVCYDILREVQRECARTPKGREIFVNTTPDVADLLYGAQYPDLEAVEEAVGRRIVVRAMRHLHPHQFEVYAR